MATNPNPLSVQSTPTGGEIIIPCDPKDFGEFIAGLLGKPQTITRKLFGSYTLNKAEIVSLFHLINQRIAQQNDATLVSFSVEVVYNDGSSILHADLHAFESYNEVRPVWPVGVELSWTYLIKFPNKNIPEKQVIDVWFIAESFGRFRSSLMPASWEQKEYELRSSSSVYFEIKHTDWTWGADMEARLSSAIVTHLRAPNPILSWLITHHDSLANAFCFIVAIVGVLIAYFNMQRFASSQASGVTPLVVNSADGQIGSEIVDKLNLVHLHIAEGAWVRFSMTTALFFVILIALALVAHSLISSLLFFQRTLSFLVFNAKAESHMKMVMRGQRQSWYWAAAKFVGNVLASVVAAVLYYWLAIDR